MSYVFRFHNGVSTLDGWDTSSQYGSMQIAAIKDPTGASAKIPITSIPSPFANFELVKNAFAQVTDIAKKQGTVKGNTIYHKMVSDALDVLEIFFGYRKFKNDFQIIPWDSTRDLNNLLNSPNPSHKKLGETLQLFIRQDSKSFNFNELGTLYLLNYVKGPKPMNIIGGTSSTSVCAASSNNLSYVNVFLSNNHKAFDANDFRALTDRDEMFVEYLWSMSMVSYVDIQGLPKSFAALFPEVFGYIQQCYSELSKNIKSRLLQIQPDEYQKGYMPLSSTNTCYFIGQIPLLTQGQRKVKSDFMINTSKVAQNVPLALPCSTYSKVGMWYNGGYWNDQNKAPVYDSNPLSQRVLPFDGSNYPYLTADDFFQPYLVRTIFPIDDSKFFTGHTSGGSKSYLVPLKPNVFKLFDVNFLFGVTNDAYHQNIFELKPIANGVKAIIRIPVQKSEYITYERIYFDNGQAPDVTNNSGQIIDCRFDLFIYPFFHSPDNVNGPQRVYLIDADTLSLSIRREYKLSLNKNDGSLIPSKEIVREDKNLFSNGYKNSETTKCFAASSEYDYIVLDNGTAQALILPKWPVCSTQARSYEFAIDFGTTNTHIEFRESGQNNITPLHYTWNDNIVESLHDKTSPSIEDNLRSLSMNAFINNVRQEFLPLSLGKDSKVGFPLRTNLCHSLNIIGIGYALTALADTSIGFHYEKEPTAKHNKCETNLKWLGGGNSDYVKAYLEELLYIIRACVISNGGSLDSTKVTWFYPISMLRYQRDQLTSTWRKLADNILSDKTPLVAYTESVAPYFYYKNQIGVTSTKAPVVSMDIGGGTTDVVIYRDDKPVVISSSRFAGNDLYGDFTGRSIQLNGFVERYGDRVRNLISDTSLASVYDNIKGRGVSSDLISFFFSLEHNSILADKGISVRFTDEMLSADQQMKAVVLLFFAGEVYHIAQIFKAKGIPTPRYMTMSGTATKVFNIFSVSALEDYVCIIFKDVLGCDSNIKLKTVDIPKEITCKGGLEATPDDANVNVSNIQFNVSGSHSFDSSEKTFNNLTEDVENEILISYKNFIRLFISIDKKFKYRDNFGIDNSSLQVYGNVLMEYADEDLTNMIKSRRDESMQSDAEISDSLFFYPLAGGINRLAYYIATH